MAALIFQRLRPWGTIAIGDFTSGYKRSLYTASPARRVTKKSTLFDYARGTSTEPFTIPRVAARESAVRDAKRCAV